MTSKDVATRDTSKDSSLLPIEQVSMPEDDVSDLRDVVDAINKLCETMKTSYDEYEDCEDVQEVEGINVELVDPNEVSIEEIHTYVAEKWCDTETGVSSPELTIEKIERQHVEMCRERSYIVEPLVRTPEEIVVNPVPVQFEKCKTDRPSDKAGEPNLGFKQVVSESIQQTEETYSCSGMELEPVTATSEPVFEKVRIYKAERRSDTVEVQRPVVATEIEVARNVITDEIEPITSDVETVQCEPMSEMYYTASSEVSLLSDADFQDKAQTEDSDKEKDDRNSVMTGHVAAMRERFESMTRTNTPCPDLLRSTSPSFEVFKNVSTSPDNLE